MFLNRCNYDDVIPTRKGMMLKVEFYQNIFTRFMLLKSFTRCFLAYGQLFLIKNMLPMFNETNYITRLDWIILGLMFLG
jgi:hypothetical protein